MIGALTRVAWAIGVLLVSTGALAESHIVAPPGGGLAEVDVKVDLVHARVEFGGASIPIALDPAQLPDERDVVVETVVIGQGQHAVHVRVPVRGSDASGRAWEAIVVSHQSAPIFSGITGFAEGDLGQRIATPAQIVPRAPTTSPLLRES